ncbi:MAG: hypothetical protein WAW25_01670, partial [Bifidobacterium adolescentis]
RFLCVTHGIFGIGFGVQIKKEIDVIRYRIRDFGFGCVAAGTSGRLFRILLVDSHPTARAADKSYAYQACGDVSQHMDYSIPHGDRAS